MVSQEQKALDRIDSMKKYIKENPNPTASTIESYMMLTFGIRPRTTQVYLLALKRMDALKWTGKGFNATCELVLGVIE